jgi:hypothetical protein
MSSTILLPTRAQLCIRYCSNKHIHTHTHTHSSEKVLESASSFSTGPPGDRSALHCRWNAIATQSIGIISVQPKRLHWNARSLSHLTFSPPPSFTQSPSPPRSLVRDGQTSPHRPRLVLSRSTCPPIFPPPPCKQLCTRSCSNKHTHAGHIFRLSNSLAICRFTNKIQLSSNTHVWHHCRNHTARAACKSMGTAGLTAHGPQTRAGIGAGGSMHFLGDGDYLGAHCFQHDPPWWNPPFPPPLHEVLTEDEWSNFFRGLNVASSLNVNRQCGCCPQTKGLAALPALAGCPA